MIPDTKRTVPIACAYDIRVGPRTPTTPIARPGRAIGVVGVLGPTRMSYAQAIGTVRFVSGLMNELVDHLYA